MARRNGGSKEVEEVMPKAKFLVTAAMAVMGCGKSEKCRRDGRKRNGIYNGRIRNRPLRSPSNALIQLALIRIIAAVGIRQEQSIDAASFEQLSQLYPVLEGAFGGRLVRGILRVY